MKTRRILVLGGTGRTGRAVVAQALELGHTVTVLVRNPKKLPDDLSAERVLVGDALDGDALRPALEGQDAVLSTIGAPPRSRDEVRARGAEALIQAMEQVGVPRLVSLSTFGVGDTRSHLPWKFKYIIVPLLLRRAFSDHEQQERHIRASRLQWTLVRPTELTDGARTGTYHAGTDVDAALLNMKISRADVAEFMLQQLSHDAYVHRAPSLSN